MKNSFSTATDRATPSFEILYEDEALIFVNKPPGFVVQRGYDPDEPVLFDSVRDLLAARGESAFLMQRLDRGTSGVIFFTKQSKVNRRVTRSFERGTIRKLYLALCRGQLRDAQTIDAPIERIGAIQFGVGEGGRRAITSLTPLISGDAGTLLAIRLHTGRTHQIRVHLAAIGHPLVGDWLYGDRDASRPMLHAHRLVMTHPVHGEPLEVEAPLPADFRDELVRRGLGDSSLAEDGPPSK
ncbi:MAG: RluA family pseudouridine synthase [Thermoanaerobaculia bacterium]